MTSENTPEAGALPADASDAHVEHHGQDDSQANVEAGVPAEVDADVAGAAGADPHAMPMPTALFVRRERRMNLGGWVVLALVARELFILALAPTVRRHRLPLPPVHFIGKAATFNLLYAFPLLVVAQFDGTVGDVAAPIAWAFVIWGVTLYWLAGLLYAVQVREMVNAVRAPQAAR